MTFYLPTIFLISIFICKGAAPIIEGQKEQTGKQGGSLASYPSYIVFDSYRRN
jgi:hypothetical protein